MSTEPETQNATQRLFALVREPLIVATPGGELRRANAAACELMGRAEEELRGLRLQDVVHPDDRAGVDSHVRELAGDGRAEGELALRIVRPDGRARRVRLKTSADAAAGLVYALVEEISGSGVEHVESLAEAFRHAALGMAMLGTDGELVRVNRTLCGLLCRSEEELRNTSIFELLADDEPGHEIWRGLRAGGRAGFQVEARMRRSDGRPVVALLSLTPVRNSRDEPLYCICIVHDITERSEAQERLQANEAKLAEAQQIARLGSWEWEIAADRLTWSDELYRIYGAPPAASPESYDSYIDKVHPDDRARVRRIIDIAVAECRPWGLDYRIIRPDGELRMIHARGEIVCDDQGRPAIVNGTCQDVTESRRVEDALRAAEQLFRRAFDDAPIGMALIDLDGSWLRLNRAISQMLGRTEKELRTQRLTDFNHPDDRQLDRPLIRELLAGRRRSFAIEKRYVRPDGRLIHALVHVSLMHGDGERPLYFLCQLVDITERRRAEAERRATQERMQAIIDNSPALVIVKDLEHRYLLVNRRWEEVFGLAGETVVGQTADDVLGERSPANDAIDDEVIATGEPREAMSTTTASDGTELSFLVVKFPLRDADGRPSGVCTIATDITERQRNARQRAELEQRLAQAQRLESVGQLAGGVAHDFNNLLSVILTCVGFAQRELSPDHPVREDVEEIGRAAERAAALTRQLLMFSRREVVQPEIVDVGALVRDLERLLNRTLSERIALRISVGPDVVPVLVDPAQLEQVLVNLAVNARDAMPSGGTLSIAVAGVDGGVRITVADDGAGMPPEVRERAFEPFFTTKGAGEGTGLGLATVHGIVTDSGGTVDIASEPGSGTVVTVFLPEAQGAAVAVEEPAKPAERATGSARVLVVEDQDPVRRQACRILEAHGYDVRDAPGGEEALAAWEPVDLLVTDMVMPAMTGHELARRARERHPGLSVVFMSGHTEDVLVLDGARHGDIAFVQKPFTRDSLLRAVEDALAEAPAASRAELR